MKVSSDPDQQACASVVGSAKAAGGKIGKDIIEILGDLSKVTMGKMMLNETRIMKKGPITTMSKM
jgi:hypothetical protein